MSRPISLRASDDAVANLGVHEDGDSNSGQYVDLYLKSVGLPPGEPWCAAWDHFRREKAAEELGLKLPAGYPSSGYCPDYKDWGRRTGNWIPAASAAADTKLIGKGDAVLFYFRKEGRVGHIGTVREVHDWGVLTTEGNTGPDAGQSVNRNGGQVCLKHRTWAQLGSGGGFVRCEF